MNKPTEAQIKEFWLKQGLILHYPDGCYYEKSLGRQFAHDGTIDLNNLFKYAVPKMMAKHYLKGYGVLIGWIKEYTDVWNKADPTLALFWALWQVKDS